jgi:enoyl reductase-like protein
MILSARPRVSRRHDNMALVGVGGIGGPDNTWHVAISFVERIPFDGFLRGCCIIVVKEVHILQSLKSLIIAVVGCLRLEIRGYTCEEHWQDQRCADHQFHYPVSALSIGSTDSLPKDVMS